MNDETRKSGDDEGRVRETIQESRAERTTGTGRGNGDGKHLVMG